MGQQQLLLLVLSTVIVGLATVAGIQAFSENQQQATQDALIQRATSIGSDIAAAAQQPSQLGGVDLGTDGTGKIASAIGLSSASGISAGGAGSDAACKITGTGSTGGNSTATVKCDSDAGGNNTSIGGGTQTITVTVTPANDEPVKVTSISVTS